MKQQKRSCSRKIAAALLSAMMSFSLIPTIAGTRKVSAAIRKTADNTSLGVSQMKSPKLGTANNVAWEGSFVYFGNYNNDRSNSVLFQRMRVDMVKPAFFWIVIRFFFKRLLTLRIIKSGIQVN